MSPVVRSASRTPSSGQKTEKSVVSRASKPRGNTSGRNTRVPGARNIVGTLLPGFSRQLSAMLSAGMPILTSLEALHDQASNPHFKRTILDVGKSIENGSALSDAMAQFPSIFDELYTNMIKGGESGGQLAETIARLASFLEASAKLRSKVKSAMMYPTIVLCLALAIATGLILFVVPVFQEMFTSLGGKLPGPTQFLVNLSRGMRKYGLYIFLGLVTIIVTFQKWKSTPSGSYRFDAFVLRTPVFGELNKKVAASRFARTFGQLIRSGVPILTALDITSGATGNKVAGQIVTNAKNIVEKGDLLSSALVNQKVFPIMLVRMLQAGEKTGKIDEMMDNIADFYDDEVETMLNGLTSLLEPLLMVFLGVIVGGIVISLFLPIFKIGEVIRGSN